MLGHTHEEIDELMGEDPRPRQRQRRQFSYNDDANTDSEYYDSDVSITSSMPSLEEISSSTDGMDEVIETSL
jgi:hypothetical protein